MTTILEIRAADNACLNILHLGTPRPSNADDWLYCKVQIRAGGFSGEFRACLTLQDFIVLREQLQDLNLTLQGEARFSTAEGQLDLRFVGNGMGGIRVVSRAQDTVGIGNVLNFDLEIDQTFLQPLIRQIQDFENHLSEQFSSKRRP